MYNVKEFQDLKKKKKVNFLKQSCDSNLQIIFHFEWKYNTSLIKTALNAITMLWLYIFNSLFS